MAPARAVTSPSFETTMGTSPISFAARSYTLLTSSRRARGTLMNRDETIGLLPTKVPAEDTPMASTRGIFDAAVLKASTMPLYW